MPPTLEVIQTQMENLKQNIEATNRRNLKALEDTEKRSLNRHNELKCMLEQAINKKADQKDVDQQKEEIDNLKGIVNKVAWIVITAVLISLIGLVVTH